MTQEQALRYIHEHPEIYLGQFGKAKDGGYICPICRNGSGPDGTGITTKGDRSRYSCWRGCFTWADIPDIIAIKEGLKPGSGAALRRAYEVYGISLTSTGHKTGGNMDKKPPEKKPEQQDYTAYYAECHARIGQTDYPQKRGLTSRTIDRFQLGYDPAFKTKEGDTFTTWEALIIPNGAEGFTARNTNPDAEPGNRYRNRGTKEPFNLQALEGDSPVFIVEGELDALSIIEVHGEAVALRGAGINNLLAEAKKAKQPLILSLDKDEAGREAETKLMEGLKAQGTPFLQADISGDYKDASAAYNGPGIVDFAKAIHSIQQSLKTEEEAAQEAEQAAYFQRAGVNLDAFFQETAKRIKPFPTGLPALDSELDGGLLTELTIIGGGTSTGKTTLAMQIVENIAKAGNNVLVISLETGKNELIARSLSRGTLEQCNKAGIPTNNALTAKQFIKGETGEEADILEAASEALRAYKDNLFIVSSLGKIGVKRIREELEANIRYTGKTPVVLIDYLQLLGTDGQTTGIRETMDEAITGLKKLAVDFKTPVIAISSISRGQYGQDANLSSFKESGGIEYSGDLLLGLQYAGAEGKKQAELEKLANKEPRKMELKILKQRLGNIGTRITLDYMQKYNFFTETGAERPR